ncbi:DNA-processing protein DprA [Roseospira visakhapatnamensis]|uniref:DNA processing protein n=1 Tax=Roseospira visakhapatnamensis TaxID=390880 RepID=A0A7W6RDW4_9PROT|nr:DNA-processing protein DprA [Roseospira visakhapatnamensis]MBB4266251.1 DNA processing protein [Roseospira visakhapatnamensis]
MVPLSSPPSPSLTDAERLDRLRLIRSENVGPVTFHRLLRQYGTAAAALEAVPELARRGGRQKALRVCSRAAAERELAALARAGVQVIAHGEAAYPRVLAPVDDSPPFLFARGHLSLLARPTVSIVGARNASLNGRKMAHRLARELARADLLVVSGMARGIDTAAHEGALEHGTAAVLAGGVDVIYPQENESLYEDLVAQGLVLSEMPLGETPQARHFPRRNRIISGLALGVVVVEGATRSGSLITARLAGEQGREVFAVPGSPLDSRAAGPNRLLRDGAVLTETADDVLRVLDDRLRAPLAEPESHPFRAGTAEPPSESDLAQARDTVLRALGPTPVTVDEIIRECQLSVAVVATVLLELDLAGRLERFSGGRVALLASP